MTTVTVWLRREHCTIASRGDLTWAFRVCGLLYSKKNEVKKEYPGFSDDGKSDILMSLQTAKENVPIDTGLHQILEGDLPPISLATQIIKAVGMKIVASNCGANDSGRMKEFMWTLQTGY